VADIVPAVNEKVEYVARHLPEASVTFDGFHVIQLANQAVDQVRQRYFKNWDCHPRNTTTAPHGCFWHWRT
jgi:transposase